MKLEDITAIGEKLQEVKFRGSTQSLFTIVSRLSGSVQQKTVQNYMRILRRDKYIYFDNGIWIARIEEQPEPDKKDKPITTAKSFDKQINALKNAKPLKDKPGTEIKKPKLNVKAQKKLQEQRQEKERRELQRLVANSNTQQHNTKITTILKEMDEKTVSVIWEDPHTYYIVCKDCYELQTGKKWTGNQDNKKLKAHIGILDQAVHTKYCQMCGAEL